MLVFWWSKRQLSWTQIAAVSEVSPLCWMPWVWSTRQELNGLGGLPWVDPEKWLCLFFLYTSPVRVLRTGISSTSPLWFWHRMNEWTAEHVPEGWTAQTTNFGNACRTEAIWGLDWCHTFIFLSSVSIHIFARSTHGEKLDPNGNDLEIHRKGQLLLLFIQVNY